MKSEREKDKEKKDNYMHKTNEMSIEKLLKIKRLIMMEYEMLELVCRLFNMLKLNFIIKRKF